MANLNIEMPDDLARSLEGIAAAQRKSIQQLALERFISLVEDIPQTSCRIPSRGAARDAGNTPPNGCGRRRTRCRHRCRPASDPGT